MNAFQSLVLPPALIAAAAAFLATPIVIGLAKRIGIVDDPRVRKRPQDIHKYPVPRGGGIAIFFGVVIAAIVFLPFDKHLVGILAGAVILTAMGIADDKYDLNPYLRLVGQFVAASAPIVAGIGIAFITNPFNGILDLSHPQITLEIFGTTKTIWILSDVFALIWIVSLMNFINMGAKGIDGQLPGVVTIAAITIALLSLRFSADITQWPVIILAAAVAGAYLGFLPWNTYPQKIMPSFSGSNLAGYFLGVLSILSTTKVGTLFVVLGIPLVDTGYTIIRRLLEGIYPVWVNTGQLNHKNL